LPADECGGCVDGGGCGGGGGCRPLSLDGMLRARGNADRAVGSDVDAPLEHPDEPSDEHDELFFDCDTGDGVPSV